jgi:lipid-A-disaccharide synthase
VACVLPHEEAFFRRAGVPATFVGHPAVDHLRGLALDEAFIGSLRPAGGGPLVALMPGSRRQEVGPILARQLAVARALAARRPECRFVVPLAEARHRGWAEPLAAASGLPVRVVVGRTHEVERAADLALVASGTATLELAFYGTPMAVFYNVTWAQWHLLGRWLVRTPYLSLPNALAGRRIVPEFIRDRPLRPDEVAEVARLLQDPAARREAARALADLRSTLERGRASANAAREVLTLVGTPVPTAARCPGRGP